MQQTEIKVSLKTYELQEAVRRCRVIASQVDDIFCKVRERLGVPDHDPICVRDALKHVQDGFEDPEAFSQPLEKWMIPSLLKRYSEASNRRVPVHKELLKMGFEAYVNRMRNEGHERLFPHLQLNKYNRSVMTIYS